MGDTRASKLKWTGPPLSPPAAAPQQDAKPRGKKPKGGDPRWKEAAEGAKQSRDCEPGERSAGEKGNKRERAGRGNDHGGNASCSPQEYLEN